MLSGYINYLNNRARQCFAVLFAIVLLLALPSAQAQTITEEQVLSFGEAVFKYNNMVYEIVLLADGSLTNDPSIVFTTSPQIGRYRITGLTPFEPITSVTVTVDTQVIGVGEDFTIDNFDISYPANADGSGEAVIYLGARLRTSGSGINYSPSTTFNGVLDLTVNH